MLKRNLTFHNKYLKTNISSEQVFGELIVQTDYGYLCISCNHQFAHKCNAKTHIEAKHVKTQGQVCTLCGFVTKTKDSLRKHISRRHNLQPKLLNAALNL